MDFQFPIKKNSINWIINKIGVSLKLAFRNLNLNLNLDFKNH